MPIDGYDIITNTHYFDLNADSMVFLVLGSFSTDREVWLKKGRRYSNSIYYHRLREGRFYDSFFIQINENRIERMLRFPNGATLQLFNLYWMSDSVNRFLRSNGSNFVESAGFFTMKQTCPWPFFTGKYILSQYEYTQKLNDSLSLYNVTQEWYARDTGILYFERTFDTLKFGKRYTRKSEKGIRQNFR